MTYNHVKDDTSFDTFAKFRADVRACIDKARCIFGVDLDPHAVVIRLDVRGRTAGWACPKRGGVYTLRFNPEAIIKYNKDMTEDTIPHEVAHLVCFANKALGSNHDDGWKRVCRMLGGDDSRTHDMTLTPAKEIKRYRYVLPSGEELQVGPKHHKRIQAGDRGLWSKKSKHQILASHYRPAGGVPNPTTPMKLFQHEEPKTLIQKVARAASAFDNRSKKQIVADLFAANPNASRGDMIQMIMDQAGMSKAGASTYYQSAKSQK